MSVGTVCVTGMHRSGTSLIARVVNLLGVDLGPEDRLMAPKPDNPAGFWESLPITQLDDDLLARLGGSWSDPPVLDDGWEGASDLDEWRDRARQLLDETFTGPVRGWKDPRCAILLPFWRTVTTVDAAIIVVRRPADVVASLERRDGFDPSIASAMWLRYMVAAHRSAPDALVVPYDGFFDDVDGWLRRLVDHLGVPDPDDDTRDRIRAFVDVGLRHHDAGGDSGPAAAVDLAEALFADLMGGRAAPLAEALHGQWVAQREASAVALRARRAEELAAAREDQRAEFEAERDKVLGLLDVAQQRVDLQLGELDRLERRASELGAALERSAARAAEAEEQLAGLQARLDELDDGRGARFVFGLWSARRPR